MHQIQVQCRLRIAIKLKYIPSRVPRLVDNRLGGGFSDGTCDIYFVLAILLIFFSLKVTNLFCLCQGTVFSVKMIFRRSVITASMDGVAVLANCVVFATGDCLSEFLQFFNPTCVYKKLSVKVELHSTQDIHFATNSSRCFLVSSSSLLRRLNSSLIPFRYPSRCGVEVR